MSEVQSYIAFGSNVGDRRANLRQALDALGQIARIVVVSPLYSTEPIGYQDQGWFLNGVVEIATSLPPRELLAELHRIEQDLGRERRIRNGPRTIDLDILKHGDTAIDEPGLTLPHPRAQERLFVIGPWADIAPGLVLPTANATLGALRQQLEGSAQVEPYALPPW